VPNIDGKAVEDEDLARGARYNSSLRFASRKEDVITLVVSEDGRVSGFDKSGGLLMPQKLDPLTYVFSAKTLDQWLDCHTASSGR
jgi:hypothetical protein